MRTGIFMKYTEPKILWLALATDALMASGDNGGNGGGNGGGIQDGGWNGDGSYIELPPVPQN